MICKKCNVEFEPKKGYLNYCSNKCKFHRDFSEESNRKKSIASKKQWEINGISKNLNWNKINGNEDKIKKVLETWKNKLKVRIDNGEPIWRGTFKKYLIEEHGHKCMICETNEWMGKFLNLELDHIDGNKNNNKLENLRILCPNYHSQTDTWRYRNIKK